MKALAIGAVLWDIINGQEYIGGAPLNLAAHLAQLGWDAAILSCVGNDQRGYKAQTELQKLGVNTRFVYQHDSLPTGIAQVELDENGMPSYDLPLSAYDQIPWSQDTFEHIRNFAPDVLCVGTHEQRSPHNRNLWQELYTAVKPRYVFYDVNLRLGFAPKNIIEGLLLQTDIFKLNDQEVECLSNVFWGCSESPEKFCQRLASECQLFCIVVTLGSDGCIVWHNGEIIHLPGYPARVVNTVGCGDAFSAGFLTSLFQSGDPLRAADCGNFLGSYVAGCEQAIPHYSSEILCTGGSKCIG